MWNLTFHPSKILTALQFRTVKNPLWLELVAGLLTLMGTESFYFAESTQTRGLLLKALLFSNLLGLAVLCWIIPWAQRKSPSLSGQQEESPGHFRSSLLSLAPLTVDIKAGHPLSGPVLRMLCRVSMGQRCHSLSAQRTCYPRIHS